MRKEFVISLKNIVKENDNIVFLTGDLGFNALEEIRYIMGDRFVNCGVAEQSMVSIAAGLASKGYSDFCYSIAPFLVFRALEQIKNDVCLHKLPVFIIGNGGGYGYGIMGSTHHAIEDIACMSSLPNMQCYLPAFAADVSSCLSSMLVQKGPAYLRLGLAVNSSFYNDLFENGFRNINLSTTSKLTVLAIGPVIKNVLPILEAKNLKDDLDVFNLIEFPFCDFSNSFSESLSKTGRLLVVEEHVKRAGIAENISLKILEKGITIKAFNSLNCLGYPSGRYGSQDFHLRESGLDRDNILKVINIMIGAC